MGDISHPHIHHLPFNILLGSIPFKWQDHCGVFISINRKVLNLKKNQIKHYIGEIRKYNIIF